MALVNTGTQTTLDESTSLQNSFTSASTAGDANDNDIAVGLLPSDFSARLSALSAGTPLRAALSGYTGVAGNTGSNILTFTPTGSAVDVWFTDSSSQALNGLDSGLDTASGESIFLYTDGVNNNVLLGKTSGGTIVMAAYLEETGTPISGAKLWTVQFEAMYHPDGTQADESLDLAGLVYATVDQERNFSLANAPSGQNLFLMYGDTEVALIATGKLPANQSTGQAINTGDTLNSSQAGGTITLGVNNQMVDPGEGLWFTFVSGANTNYTVPNLSEGEADVEANIAFTGLVNSQAASFRVVQLQKDKSATVRVTAYSTDVESGAAYVDGLGDANDVKVNITLVQVFDPNGVDVTAARNVVISGGVVTLSNVLATDEVHYHTASNHQRVLIENGGDGTDGSASFDVGGFRLLEPQREATSIGAQIRFEDSAPAVTLATPTDTVILNTQDVDTEGSASDTDAQSFAAAFTVGSSDYGTDGAGSTVWSYAFSVASQGVDSGLNAAAGNIYLYLISGKIVGSTSATLGGVTADNTVFDLTVNSSTGNVTLSQYSAIEHDGPGTSSNFDTQEAVLGTGLAYLNATATITDQDGDSTIDSKSIDLGGNVAFDDDGPGISQSEPTDTVVLNTQDADTEGSATDTDAQSFAASFALAGSDYGGDGAGSTVWSYAFSVASQGVDSGLNAAAGNIYLYLIGGKIVGSTSATQGGVTAGNTVFDLAVNSSTGNVTLAQYSAIEHDGPGASSNFDTQEAVLGTGLAYLNATATITDHDGDTHEDTEGLDLGGNVAFDDDGPAVVQAAPTDTVVLNTQDDECKGAATDTDVQSFASSFTLSSADYGGDGAGSEVWSYAFSLTTQGGDSGLNAETGDIRLYLIGGKIIGSTGLTAGDITADNTIFDLEVNASTGAVTLTQYSAVEHPGPGWDKDHVLQEVLLATDLAYLNATVTITDEDGDSHQHTQSLDLGGNVAIDDNGPIVDHFDDLSGPNDGAPMAGTYAFDIAADVVTNDADDGVVLMALSGTTGNGRAIFGTSLSWASESDTQVTYNFGFQYYAGPFDTTANSASGTVMFNKSNGTFEFDMNGLIGGDAMTSTGGPIARYDYDTEGNKSPEIVVQEYTSGIFGVLTGQAALNPSSPASLKAGGNYAFAPGETLSSATVGYINVATATLGVNSDTIQQGELVNFDLYTSNPVAGPTSPPKQSGAVVNTSTQRATTDHLNVVLDQWHEGEDLAIVLKLYNMSTQQITTRLLLADASSDFEAVDKYHVVRIGTGDYDSAVYQICGLQVTTSTDRLTGTGYRLSDGSAKALTADGKGFEDTADNDVIKLVRIDLDTPVITTYDADLNFSGRVIDSDDDWAIFDFDVHIEADAVVTLTGMAGQVPGAVI